MKSELEIELLHDKINLIREHEMAQMVRLLDIQRQQINRVERLLNRPMEPEH